MASACEFQFERVNAACSGPCGAVHSSAVVIGSQMIVFGGRAKSGLVGGINVLDLDKMAWWMPAIKGNFPTPRQGHAAVACGDKMVIFGGLTLLELANDFFLLNSNTWEWSVPKLSGHPSASKHNHSLVCVATGPTTYKLIIFGGYSDAGSITNDVQVLDTDFWRWSRPVCSGSIPPREGHTASLMGQNMVVIGGNTDAGHSTDVFVLNIDNWSWSSPKISGHFLPRSGHTVVQQGNHQLFVFGGCSVLTNTNDLDILDTNSWKWIQPQVSQRPRERQGHIAALMTNESGGDGGENNNEKKSGVSFVILLGESTSGLLDDLWLAKLVQL